jgi:hypothetical protein
MGLKAVGGYRVPWIGVRAGSIYEASLGIGAFVARMRGDKPQGPTADEIAALD